MAVPTYGTDATGANTYVAVIAAQTTSDWWNRGYAWCSTNGALLSFDAGTTGHVPIPAGTAPIPFSMPKGTKSAVYAANLVTDSNYANLYVCVYRED